jgi:hypothetical protein
MILLRVGENQHLDPPIPDRPHLAETLKHGCIRSPVYQNIHTPRSQKNCIALTNIKEVERSHRLAALGRSNRTTSNGGQQEH